MKKLYEKIENKEDGSVDFYIQSLDGMPIKKREKKIKKAFFQITGEIERYKHEYNEAHDISSSYADMYCFNDFSINYRGEEQKIFDEIVERSADKIAKQYASGETFKKALKLGLATPIPFLGDKLCLREHEKTPGDETGFALAFGVLKTFTLVTGYVIPVMLALNASIVLVESVANIDAISNRNDRDELRNTIDLYAHNLSSSQA